MRHVFIDPFGPNETNGVKSYLSTLQEILPSEEISWFKNDSSLSQQHFQEVVERYICSNFGSDEVIIEASESRAPTLFVPRQYRVHLRLHCPLAIAQRYDGKVPNQTQFSHELRVISKAWVVSSPSHALIGELDQEIDLARAIVYPNPISKIVIGPTPVRYDVLFMGRFQALKGIDYINPFLELLPAHLKVLIVGKGATRFQLSAAIKCRVEVREEIVGESRFKVVAAARTALLLSRFENCSMFLLECVALNIPVFGWDVGGNAEVGDGAAGYMYLHRLGDVYSLADSVLQHLGSDSEPDYRKSAAVIEKVNADFQRGFREVENRLRTRRILRDGELSVRGQRLNAPEPVGSSALGAGAGDLSALAGMRVFGISVSNEHIQELWEPLFDRLGCVTQYACRRPQGCHTLFGGGRTIAAARYHHFDWVAELPSLLVKIKEFAPERLVFHNGLLEGYGAALAAIINLGIPVVFTELGWLPQRDHFFIDRLGVGGRSELAQMSFREMTGREHCALDAAPANPDGPLLVLTQLEGDTNIRVMSDRFKSMENFVAHIIRHADEGREIIIRPHPLDKQVERFDALLGANVRLDRDSALDALMAAACCTVGINSTALVEALGHEGMVVFFGDCILSNKQIAIDGREVNLADLLKHPVPISRLDRKLVLEALKKWQINVSTVGVCPDATLSTSPSITALLRPLVHGHRSASKLDQVAGTGLPSMGRHLAKKGTAFRRKLRKLWTNPKLFLRDLRNNFKILLG